MKKKIYLLAAIFALSFVLTAAKLVWKVKSESSNVTFTLKNLGMDVNGSFSGLSADIQFDEKDPSSTRISATIDASTVNTENVKRDQHLKQADYFDVKNFPKITFVSNQVKKQGLTYLADGELTMKGNVKKLTIPFQFRKQGGKGIFEGVFSINRIDFGVGESSMSMSDSVKVTLKVIASR